MVKNPITLSKGDLIYYSSPEQAQTRAALRKQDASGPAPLAGLAEGLNLPEAAHRLGAVDAKADMLRRGALSFAHVGAVKGLIEGGLAEKIAQVRRVASDSDLRPEVRQAKALSAASDIMTQVRHKLEPVAQTAKAWPKRFGEALDAALVDDATDPLTSASAIQAMEVRQRIGSMDPAQRIAAAFAAADAGQLGVIRALASDPLGPQLPADVLGECKARAVAAAGAPGLVADLQLAQEYHGEALAQLDEVEHALASALSRVCGVEVRTSGPRFGGE